MGNAENQRNYRKRHPNYDRHHKDRQDRYIARLKAGLVKGRKPLIIKKRPPAKKNTIKVNTDLSISKEELKIKVLTHYGGGKCACVKCGIDDRDCLNLDHINNDAHHRQNNGRVGGTALYRKLLKADYPTGYQTLCHNCNMKKAIEFCRKNGGHKKGKPRLDPLPLFTYGIDVLDVTNQQTIGLTSDDTIKTSDDTIETSDVIYEITAF